MANLTYPYEYYYEPSLKVSITVFTLPGKDIGNCQYWLKLIWQLYNHIPFPDLFANLALEIWHNLHPDKPADFATYGAAGLTWSGEGIERILIQLDEKSSTDYREQILSHEFWHEVGGQSGLRASNYCGNLLTALFEKYRPKHAVYNGRTDTVEAMCEDFAEAGKAIFGTNNTVGRFSDNIAFTPIPELTILLRLFYPIYYYLRNQEVINMEILDNHIRWQRMEGWLIFRKPVWEAMTYNFGLFKWNGISWNRI